MAKRTAVADTPRGWAPTARDAVLACAPMTSLMGALGLGGAGYLTGRAGVAACGAVVGGVGVYAERVQAREIRRRSRRDRARFRTETAALLGTVEELRREIGAVRDDLEERSRTHASALEVALRSVQEAARQADAGRPAAPPPVPWIAQPAVPVDAPVPVAAGAPPVGTPVATTGGVWVQDARPAPSPFFTPAAFNTGGIPVLDPGPGTRLTDRTSDRTVVTAQAADALVYAALDLAEEDRVTRGLAHPELVGAGVGGSAGHAGSGTATPKLVVVRRAKHAA